MQQIRLSHSAKLPKVKQIVQAIVSQIEKGQLVKDDRLPSINEFSDRYGVARDTVERAYKELKDRGYITSVATKGYFVLGKKDQRLKILLIFNKLSSYKKIIYESLVQTLGEEARVDLQIHRYDPQLLKEIIENNLGNYHYYVVMPYFLEHTDMEECLSILRMIPENELILLDKHLPELGGQFISVYQDFKWDIYNALKESADLMDKYERLKFVFPEYTDFQTEIKDGVLAFCEEYGKDFSVVSDLNEEVLFPSTAYITAAEEDLAELIKKVRKSDYQLGKDIGIISFNETVFKELLDITVVTTDFENMGSSVADLILKGQTKQLRNPFKMIRRSSL
jgi:DNA-binding transcriptional regulator YhcF (GntR family)